MATKLYGTSIALPAPFVAGSCDPVDARLVVENLSDITTNAGDTFGTVTDYCKIYEGIQVYVSAEKATYMYVGPAVAGSGILTTEAQKAENWRKISSSTTSSDKIEEAINNAEQNAKDYADSKISALDKEDTAVAGQYVDSVSETDGIITVTRKPVTSTNKTITIGTTNGLDVDVNIDGKTIVRDGESGQLSVASSALVQYAGENAINVSEVSEEGNTKTISLKLNTADKVLTQTTDGLLANLNLTWSNTDGLKLIGKDSTVIATVPAADFIKDGMLENVELKEASAVDPIEDETSGTFLVFTFNTDAGSKVINLDVTSLIDVYTAGDGISVTGKVIAAKLDASTEAFLTVGADGIKLSGVQDAINAAKQEVQTEVDAIETAVGLGTNGSFTAPEGSNYTDEATTVMDAISKLDTQVKTNADAIAAETSRATAEETRITDTVIGEDQLEEGKSVMDVILENEETTQQAIAKLATATGVLSGEEIKYTAPSVSGEFSSTTSIMDMLNKIDEKWNTIDCGTY